MFEIIRRGRRGPLVCGDADRPAGIPDQAVCVCEILVQVRVSAPTISHHLKELRTAGLVEVYHRGQWAYYAVREDAVAALAAYFQRAGRAKKSCCETETTRHG